MNKDWAEKNKRMQALTGKEAGFREGMDVPADLRKGWRSWNKTGNKRICLQKKLPVRTDWQLHLSDEKDV